MRDQTCHSTVRQLMERMHHQVWHYAIGATVIKRIELVNFMSHERTVIEPDAGLTVLVGPNNCGKSAFVAALQILCHNAKSNYVLRHGEKQCEIIVETDDGHIINWSKKKSGSPKYVINGKPFDRLRQGIPQELHDILGLSKVTCEKDQFDIHFGEQKSPVFLLNDSGKAAAQFFASSSDAIRLVEMQDRHKGKVRDSKRDQSRLSDEKQQLTEDLETLQPLDELETRLATCEAQYESIHQTVQQIEQLHIMIRAIEHLNQELVKQEAVSETLSGLVEPPELQESAPLARLIGRLKKAFFDCQRASAMATSFSDLTAPPKIQDESKLLSILDGLGSCHRQLDFHSATANVLEHLIAPPEIQNERLLSDSIGNIQSASRKLMAVETRAKLLADLQPAPEIADYHPLDQLLKDIAKTEKLVEKSTQSLQILTGEFEELNAEVESWVEENPTCPTCGSETTVDQLIGAGVDSGKGHRHG